MKTRHKPKTAEKKRGVKELEARMANFRLPSGPFDYVKRAAAVAETHAFFDEACALWRTNEWSEEYGDLRVRCRTLYHAAIDAAYPPGFWEVYKSKSAAGLEAAILFLEADPFFFRTGYIKKDLIRFIKPPMLSPDDVSRLQTVVLNLVDKRDDRDFRAFCRLARKVDAPKLREKLTQKLNSENRDVRRRARWVLEALEQKQ